MTSTTTTSIPLPPGAFVRDISGDGRYVTYAVTSGTPAVQTLFLLDRSSGAVQTVASFPYTTSLVFQTGVSGGLLSGDGRYVFYGTGVEAGVQAFAAPGNIFVYDRSFAVSKKVTPSSGSPQSFDPLAISNDGGDIYYLRLMEGASSQLVVKNVATDQVFIVADSLNNIGLRESSLFNFFGLSGDGQFASFGNKILNLATGSIKTVNSSLIGDEDFSENGRFVLVNDGGVDGKQITILDLRNGVEQIASTNVDGINANADTLSVGISPNGRYVLFQSNADNLVPNDTIDSSLFLKDLVSGQIIIIPGYTSAASNKAFVTNDGRVLFQQGDAVVQVEVSGPSLTFNPVAGDNVINGVEQNAVCCRPLSSGQRLPA
jgi:hypothetical protein